MNKIVVYLKGKEKPIVLSGVKDSTNEILDVLREIQLKRTKVCVEIYNQRDYLQITDQHQIQAVHVQSDKVINPNKLNDSKNAGEDALDILKDLDIDPDEEMKIEVTEKPEKKVQKKPEITPIPKEPPPPLCGKMAPEVPVVMGQKIENEPVKEVINEEDDLVISKEEMEAIKEFEEFESDVKK
jgi:hypothetical protein